MPRRQDPHRRRNAPPDLTGGEPADTDVAAPHLIHLLNGALGSVVGPVPCDGSPLPGVWQQVADACHDPDYDGPLAAVLREALSPAPLHLCHNEVWWEEGWRWVTAHTRRWAITRAYEATRPPRPGNATPPTATLSGAVSCPD